MAYSDEIKLEEYRALQEEHRRNRSYIFGSPLLVLGAVAAGLEYSGKKDSGESGLFVLSVLIFVITFSLWFLRNRLKSDARIVSYIQLVHEGQLKAQWKGWESMLREYRIWIQKRNDAKDLATSRDKWIEQDAVPCALMFYPAIWTLYIILVLAVSALISIKAIPLFNQTQLISPLWVALATALCAVIVFFSYASKSMRPGKLNAVYEEERATWLCVFDYVKNKKN